MSVSPRRGRKGRQFRKTEATDTAAENTAEKIARQAYDLCARLMPVRECRLYGSRAGGDYDPESDADILIGVELPETERKRYRRAAA